MFEFLSMANEIIVLLSGLMGLIGTVIGTYFAIKNWIKALKEKTDKEHWAMIMELADTAMAEAENTQLSGMDKKAQVLEVVKASTKAVGLNIDDFIVQLDSYIDQTIAFVNKMKNNKK